MSIAGHVSRAMLSRYSHVRMEAKRRALDEIAERQRAADEKRPQEIQRQQAAVVASESLMRFRERSVHTLLLHVEPATGGRSRRFPISVMGNPLSAVHTSSMRTSGPQRRILVNGAVLWGEATATPLPSGPGSGLRCTCAAAAAEPTSQFRLLHCRIAGGQPGSTSRAGVG